jgi:AcrR family transcriptional regulator
MTRSTRARLVSAAFELFAEQGYAQTSVEEIAARAGTGRTTFFRHFPSKDDVVFPDHDALLRQVDARLATATAASHATALREAARLVLDHYLGEGDLARTRYALTRSVPALRERELASVHRYFRVFSSHARAWFEGEEDGPLRGELLASAVITAHNLVLRSWLRRATSDPVRDFDRAIDRVLPLGAPRPTTSRTVVVHIGDSDVEGVVAGVREALARADVEATSPRGLTRSGS